MGSVHSSKKDVQRDPAGVPSRTVDTDVVTLKAMRFHARIGVLPHEAEIAQSIEVDASLWVRRGGAPLGRQRELILVGPANFVLAGYRFGCTAHVRAAGAILSQVHVPLDLPQLLGVERLRWLAQILRHAKAQAAG